jgi:predicted dehydrogenase
MTLRIGLIGAGANTVSQHVPGFRKLADVEVTGVVNRSRESSERVAGELGIPRVFDSPEEMCADPEIDAVCIGTWPYRHREYTLMALEAGKHVLCEARMAMNADEAKDMLAASERHPGLVAQLVPAPFDFRLGPTITRLINEGLLGDIHAVSVRVLNGSGLDTSAPLHWRMRSDYSGKNVMTFGIFVEVIHRWLGDHDYVLADGGIDNPHVAHTVREVGQLNRGALTH